MPSPFIAPVFDPNRGWRMWERSEIYTGVLGPGEYVPNVGDGVWDWTAGVFKVVAVNPTTHESTLVLHTFPDQSGPDDQDVFLGAGPGPVGESFRMYVDKSVLPHSMAFDARVRIYSTEAHHVKVFLGTDISVAGTIISAYYNESMILQGENIPLDSITVPSISDAPIKIPRIGYTSYDLHNGEVVAAVTYNLAGQAICVAKFVVNETAFIRQPDTGQKYITNIHLESSYISNINNRLIEYPVNITLQSVPLMGVVTYSDGSSLRLPVDGNKFMLYGRDQFVSTIVGQRIPLVLSYRLGPDESNYITQSSHNQQISVDYEATTIAEDGTYSVKLFVFPVWTVPGAGLPYYRLEYFLYNLDRQQYFHVTPYIEVPSGAHVFDPTMYAIQQNLTVAIDLSRVNGAFNEYRHVQTFKVALYNQGDDDTLEDTRWTITYDNVQDPLYGEHLTAVCTYQNVNTYGVDLTAGAESVDAWLDKTYYATKPLMNPNVESLSDIRPTHFKLRTSNFPNQYLTNDPAYLIDQYDQVFNVDSVDIDEGGVIYVDFIKRTATTDLQMGTAGIPLVGFNTPP